MHQNKGKSIADCLADRTDYAVNPNKTNDSEYISSYECDPKTVKGEFLLSKRIYSDITGREQKNDVIAYCQTAHCGRCEQHFIVGAFTSPTVRFGR